MTTHKQSRKVVCPSCGGTATVLDSRHDQGTGDQDPPRDRGDWGVDDAVCLMCGHLPLGDVPRRRAGD